jgi:hypothetical protein
MQVAKSARERQHTQHQTDPETDEIEGFPVHLDFLLGEDFDVARSRGGLGLTVMALAGDGSWTCRSSRSGGWRRGRPRCRRGSTRRTDQIAPVRVVLEFLGCRRRRAAARPRRAEGADQPVGSPRPPRTGHHASRAGRALDLEIVAVVARRLQQRADDQEVDRASRPARASWSCRRTCRCRTRPADTRPDTPGRRPR